VAKSERERTGGNSGGNSRLPLLLYERRLSDPREFQGSRGEGGGNRDVIPTIPRLSAALSTKPVRPPVNFSVRHFATRSSRSSSRGIPGSPKFSHSFSIHGAVRFLVGRLSALTFLLRCATRGCRGSTLTAIRKRVLSRHVAEVTARRVHCCLELRVCSFSGSFIESNDGIAREAAESLTVI